MTIELKEEDCKIKVREKYPRASMKVGLMPQIITIKHKPTGIKARVCTEHFRSQHHARAVAFAMLEWALSEAMP